MRRRRESMTMHVRGCESKQRRRPLSVAGGIDMISNLPDDVILRILGLLDARDAVRTGAVCRRWRGLWTHAPALRFDSSPMRGFTGANIGLDRYVAFVNGVLARRGQDAAVLEHLAISFATDHIARRARNRDAVEQNRWMSMEAARGWTRYAVQHAVKSFDLELLLPPWYLDMSVVVLDDLPSSARLETMRLYLNGADVRLPATAAYKSLTDLSLERVKLSAAGAFLLNRFLSSACCPRLQKLRLRCIRVTTRPQQSLVLEAPALLELSIEGMLGWEILELRTRSLRALRMDLCCPDTLKISAPRLEELEVNLNYQPRHIDIHGDQLRCMTRIKVHLCSHLFSVVDNGVSMHLLGRCTSATHLEVSLHVTQGTERPLAVDTTKSRILPQLPHVKYLTVNVYLRELHFFGVGVANILKQCSNLAYLRLHCSLQMGPVKPSLFLWDHPDPWQSHEISLPHLQEVEFTRLAGTHCELGFMQYVISNAKQLEKVTVSFDHKYSLLQHRRRCFKLIPQLDGGEWNACSEAYMSFEWKPVLVSY